MLPRRRIHGRLSSRAVANAFGGRIAPPVPSSRSRAALSIIAASIAAAASSSQGSSGFWHDANRLVCQPKWGASSPKFASSTAEASPVLRRGAVVVGDDQPPTGVARCVNQRVPINRFDGVRVDDAGSDSLRRSDSAAARHW